MDPATLHELQSLQIWAGCVLGPILERWSMCQGVQAGSWLPSSSRTDISSRTDSAQILPKTGISLFEIFVSILPIAFLNWCKGLLLSLAGLSYGLAGASRKGCEATPLQAGCSPAEGDMHPGLLVWYCDSMHASMCELVCACASAYGCLYVGI